VNNFVRKSKKYFSEEEIQFNELEAKVKFLLFINIKNDKYF
jgi:hypothetical protein